MENLNRPEHEYDECVAKGICSINPALSSMQAVIILYLEHLAFYILELEKLGAHNTKIKDNFINAFSSVIENIEYTQEAFDKIIQSLYSELYQTRDFYIELCQKNNVQPNYLKSPIKMSKQFQLTDAIRQGQKYFNKRIETLNEEIKQLFEILMLISKSICLYLVELQDLEVNIEEPYKAILSIFSLMNFSDISNEKLNELIQKFTKLDHKLMMQTFEARKSNFGDFMETEVSYTIHPGKSILVSGANLKDLQMLLEATKDSGLNIYTHGQMITAHSFPEFKKYPHLVGNYGRGMEYYALDYSSFPGAVLMTKNSLQKTSYIYRGLLFTTDVFASKEVMKIENYNFEPLIEAAKKAEGFSKTIDIKSVKIGLVESEYYEHVQKVIEKINSGEIKHIFAIGVSNKTQDQEKYFEEFLNLMGDDCFAFSFSYDNGKENVLFKNMDYGYPIAYKTFDAIYESITKAGIKPILLITRCEPHTIPTFLNTKFMGLNKIYFSGCSPMLINPQLVELIMKTYNIKTYTNPKSDFLEMTRRTD